MRALITGVTGFAGSHLAEHLLACGDQVLGCSQSAQWSEAIPERLRQEIELVGWDAASDSEDALLDRARRFGVEGVYHLAAISVPSECGTESPTAIAERTNVEGTRAICRIANRLDARCLFTSSCYVYGSVSPSHPWVDESALVAPNRGYGKTKLAAEQVLREEFDQSGLDAVIARAFQHTGPRQSPRMILPDWIQQFTNSQEPIRVICLDTFLDLSDVRDMVHAYRMLMLDGKSQETYNVGGGNNYRSGDLFELVRQSCDPDRRVIELAPGIRQHPIADTSKLQAATGWRPKWKIEATIEETINYWRRKAESG